MIEHKLYLLEASSDENTATFKIATNYKIASLEDAQIKFSTSAVFDAAHGAARMIDVDISTGQFTLHKNDFRPEIGDQKQCPDI